MHSTMNVYVKLICIALEKECATVPTSIRLKKRIRGPLFHGVKLLKNVCKFCENIFTHQFII